MKDEGTFKIGEKAKETNQNKYSNMENKVQC
jgi:hypothetical protein